MVERKISTEQVVGRMVQMLSQYGKEETHPRCICYCLTPRYCEEIAELFKSKDFTAEVYFSRDYNQTGSTPEHIRRRHEETLQRFKEGRTQIICATKALGRGVDLVQDIRFVFHPVLPTSLVEYVQQTGRVSSLWEIKQRQCCCSPFLFTKDGP